MRIRTILKAAAVPGIIAAGLLGTSAAAFASTGPNTAGNNGNQSAGQSAGVTAKYADSYTDPWFGPVSCTETQHPAHGKQLGFDSITCTSTVHDANGVLQPLQNAPAGSTFAPYAQTNNWYSDFDGHPLGTLVVTVNANGTGYTGTATYPGNYPNS